MSLLIQTYQWLETNMVSNHLAIQLILALFYFTLLSNLSIMNVILLFKWI